MGAQSSLMRGDFVGAAMQARNDFIALKATMMANPFIAVVSALAADGAALAAVAWRKHQADLEANREAVEKLADATERYNRVLRDLKFRNATPEKKLWILEGERTGLEIERRALEEGKKTFNYSVTGSDTASVNYRRALLELKRKSR